MAKRRAHGQGTIYHDPERDRWIGEYNDGRDPVTGRRRRRKVTGATRKAVAARLDELRLDAREGVDVHAAGPTIGVLYATWIERKAERVTPATLKMYRDLWNVHVGPTYAARTVDSLTVPEIEASRHRASRVRSPRRRRRRFSPQRSTAVWRRG